MYEIDEASGLGSKVLRGVAPTDIIAQNSHIIQSPHADQHGQEEERTNVSHVARRDRVS